MTVRNSSLVASVAFVLAAGACHRSPQIAFARMLDQAASWAASVEFAEQMRRAGNVPQAYANDLLRHGAEEVTALQVKLSKFDEIASSTQYEASTLCGHLAAILQSAHQSHRPVDSRELRGVETRLRDLARSVRGAEPSSSRGESR